MKNQGQIIIIGAGMAGIAAARTLHDSGCAVKILEGRGRIGGRTHTDSSLGLPIDLGGAWIHGQYGNPLRPLADRFGVATGYTDFNNDFGDSVLAFDADGRRLDTAAYTRGARAWRGAINHLFGSILHAPPPPECRSLADLYAHGLPNLDLEAMSQDERLGYYYTSAVKPAYEAAADLPLMDWRLGMEFVALPGGDLLMHGGGFKRIVDGLAEGLEIELDTAVEQINYANGEVTISTSRGEYAAEKVIVTVPLGVLQSGSITFDPALPGEKRAAIGRLGMGNYEKIALRFPHIFWPLEPHRINYLSEGDPELYQAWLNIAHYTQEPVLVSYHAGRRAQHINQWSDEQLVDGCLSVLRKMFGRDIPDPESYVRTGWGTDPFSRGSYSFAKVGSLATDRETLAQGVDGRLFFAGEATHPHYFATVHGAYETGIRAAREVMGIKE